MTAHPSKAFCCPPSPGPSPSTPLPRLHYLLRLLHLLEIQSEGNVPYRLIVARHVDETASQPSEERTKLNSMHIHVATQHRINTFQHRTKDRRLNIIGISAGYHDSACSLIQDGILVAAVQEERFSRIKNDKAFPAKAFRYCLEQGGISIADIDCIAFYEDPCLKLGRQLWMGMLPDLPATRHESIIDRAIARQPVQIIRTLFGYKGPIEIVEHHLSHAASSYYFSGFEEAAILTVDGVGDWATTTYGSGEGSTIRRFEQVDFPHSLGFFYSAITAYLGFEVNEGEYKVMGLAPYGQPTLVGKIRRLIETVSAGQYWLNMQYFAFLSRGFMYTEQLCDLLGCPPRVPESEITQFHMDVASSVQVVLEEVLLEKVRYLHSKVPCDNFCMAGGVALNVVANSRCLREGPFKRLFVQPAAGDAGGSVGAAAVAHVRSTGKSPLSARMQHVYLGPANSTNEVYQLLRSSSARFNDFRGAEDKLIEVTVDRLLEGKTIAWVYGRMEFGPRSLGARSILADPRRADMRDRINRMVKMRESFRPFAPVVLESVAHEHFDLDHPSPFMLETCRVISPLDLPAVTHVDGSARVQTVNRETNPRLSALLEAFDRRTGCPILLNTSLNIRGEPIVCTTYDALICFVRSAIDVLVIEDYVVERKDIPPIWSIQAQLASSSQPRDGEGVGHLVYTLF
jgi:carbamoyltransferase